MRIDVRLLVNGAYVGSVPLETSMGDDAAVEVAGLIQLLRPLVDRAVLARLEARAAGAAFAPVAALSADDVPLRFDVATLQLEFTLPTDARAVTALSITDVADYSGASIAPPASPSLGLTVALTNRFVHSGGGFAGNGREPLGGIVRGVGNVGGLGGVYLAFEAGLQEGGSAYRNRVTLFHDDVERAVRWSGGDVALGGMGAYQLPLNLVGVGIERLYQTIQPYRNVRPSGRGGLALERPSRVDVVVNGQVYRTLDLAPGRYDLRDFPFLSGLNDVRLIVQDQTGRNETISLSFFSDLELLEPGLSIFSAGLGFRESPGGLFDDTRYDSSPVITGFYQRGLTDALTVGVAGQADGRNALVSGHSALATRFGVFGVEAALDFDGPGGVEQALTLGWRLQTSTAGGLGGWAVDVEYLSAGFAPLERFDGIANPFSWRVDARYETLLVYDVFASFGGGYSVGRGLQEDERRFTASFSRAVGRVSFGLAFDHRTIRGTDENRVTFSVSLPLTSRDSVRARFDSARGGVVAEYDRRAFEALDQTAVRAGLVADDQGSGLNLEVQHYSNRFGALLRHDRTEDQNGQRRETTDAAVTFGVGYADGRWALGRDADRGFVIVDPHPTLRDSTVFVRSRYSQGETARSGALGPALAPLVRPYVLDSIQVRVEDLPLGYDIGAGQIDIVPGPGSGYRMRIGSAASNTIIGRIEDAQGEPAEFLAGVLRPIEGVEAAEAQFFTNRTGRMVAQRVAPGRYAVVPAGASAPIGEIIVPQGVNGVVQVGTLILAGGATP